MRGYYLGMTMGYITSFRRRMPTKVAKRLNWNGTSELRLSQSVTVQKVIPQSTSDTFTLSQSVEVVKVSARRLRDDLSITQQASFERDFNRTTVASLAFSQLVKAIVIPNHNIAHLLAFTDIARGYRAIGDGPMSLFQFQQTTSVQKRASRTLSHGFPLSQRVNLSVTRRLSSNLALQQSLSVVKLLKKPLISSFPLSQSVSGQKRATRSITNPIVFTQSASAIRIPRITISAGL